MALRITALVLLLYVSSNLEIGPNVLDPFLYIRPLLWVLSGVECVLKSPGFEGQFLLMDVCIQQFLASVI